jgi:hypothetical protein
MSQFRVLFLAMVHSWTDASGCNMRLHVAEYMVAVR